MLLNRSRALRLMEQAGVDALVLTQPNNFLYFTDFTQVNSFSFIDRPAICLFFADPQMAPIAIIPRWNLSAFSRVSWITDVVAYAEHTSSGDTEEAGGWRAALRRVLAERQEARTIGVEEKVVPKWIIDVVIEATSGRRIVHSSELIRWIRSVKTEDEIRHLRAAAQVLDVASAEMLAAAGTGVTEAELAATFRASVGRQGAEGIKNFVLGFGPETVITHKVPGDRALSDGDLIRFDLGAQFSGYYADNARTYVWSSASDEQSRLYEAISHGQEQGVAMLRPGVTAGEVYDATVDGVRETLPQARMEHVGHGIGVEHHESPALIHGSPLTLETNMVINLETLYYDDDQGAFAIEDTYLITEHGSERWTELARELELRPGGA